MIDKKQRIELRSKAQTLKPVVLVGLEGFTENVIKQMDEELFNHELIKIGMQETAPTPTEFELTEMAVKLGADLVTTIGRKIVLYRHSEKKGVTHALNEENPSTKTNLPKKRTTGKRVGKTYKEKKTEKLNREKFNDQINRENSANSRNLKNKYSNKSTSTKSGNLKNNSAKNNKTRTNKTYKKSV